MSTDQVPADNPDVLRRILANTDVLMLDFDGPICSIFSGIPAQYIARQLREVLADGGHIDLPAEIDKTGDPFELLHYAATLGQDEANYVEAALRAYEVEAVATAEPTPGARDLIISWHAIDRATAVVSNNSLPAVEAYLNRLDLSPYITLISARTVADPSLLKPARHLLDKVFEALGKSPQRCTLVGDSATDSQAAAAANCRMVGYANKTGKLKMFQSMSVDGITTSMSTLAMVINE